MVVNIYYTHLYKYPVELVSKVHLEKYPNSRDPNVISVETIQTDTDARRTYYKRIAYCKNIIPSLLCKLIGLKIRGIELEEECWIYPKERRMDVKCRNLTWNNYVQLWERSMYRPAEESPEWTFFEQQGQIDLQCLGKFGFILESFFKRFLNGGVAKGWNIMEALLAERTSSGNQNVQNYISDKGL